MPPLNYHRSRKGGGKRRAARRRGRTQFTAGWPWLVIQLRSLARALFRAPGLARLPTIIFLARERRVWLKWFAACAADLDLGHSLRIYTHVPPDVVMCRERLSTSDGPPLAL